MLTVRGYVTVRAAPATQIALKNCAPFTKCIIKIDETTIGDAEDLDLVLPRYSLIEYSSNYSETTGSLWFYYKDEQLILMMILLIMIILNLSSIRLNLLGNTAAQPAPNAANGILKNATTAVPLKYLLIYLEVSRNTID